MGTRIFKKPDLSKPRIEISESIFRDPKELEALKSKIKPELYLSLVYQKIEMKEKELVLLSRDFEAKRSATEESYITDKNKLERDINALEDVLIGKREERTYLEKPLIEKEFALRERSKVLDEQAEAIKDKEQSVLDKERQCDQRMESLQDLASELGEKSLLLHKRENKLTQLESVLKEREKEHLIKAELLNQKMRSDSEQLSKREYAANLKEINIEGARENIQIREQKLAKEGLLVKSQRQALLAAQKR